ncbi:eukaryotic translation initiation factor 4E1-like [Contarinia nasturtii]|uniref:eukaryotic translation initiation factor 4E1-like n=1 Tax=Contarinia nasturtii TaxID=265458 RepID=UPI0012D460B5|nr:eukaryotic translation initiation factor 4E1-like [Contarinia nasturtii]
MAKSSAEEVEKTENNETIVKKFPENASEIGKDASIESLIKHPLQNSWTLWYYDHEKGKTWEACQHQITTFDTVEDFWSLYNHIKQPTEIKNGNDYSLFKNNIRPMWEDEQNKNGGRWIINLQKFFRPHELDKLWLEVILCLIGEAFDYSEDICGAVVNVRLNRHKIAIWTSNNNKQRILSIGRKLKESLNIPQELQIQYELHKETAFKHGGKAAAYTL